jgi:hypothetical protein
MPAIVHRHRDDLAPSELTVDQLEHIRNFDRIRRLGEQSLAPKKELRAPYGTLKKAQLVDPDHYLEARSHPTARIGPQPFNVSREALASRAK